MIYRVHHILTCIILYCSILLNAQQNLILNGGFEDTLWCEPFGNGNVAKFHYVTNPTTGSPDAYHYCGYNSLTFNSTRSRNGWGRVGFYLNSIIGMDIREYLQMSIQDSLYMNSRYCFNAYFRTINPCKYVNSSVGVKFFNTSQFYNTNSVISVLPDIQNINSNLIDTFSYVLVSGLYIASGGEKNIIIGNFLTDLNSNFILKYPSNQIDRSYVTVDDVSLIPTDIDLGNDTTLCSESDSLLIGEPNWVETNYRWYANGILIDSINGQIKVKPNSTTTYIVQKETSCITTFDTLLVTYTGACPIQLSDIKEPIIPNVFSPNGDDVNEFWKITLPSGTKLNNLEVYNRWGNIVFTSVDTIKPWFGRTTSGEACIEGVYFYVLRYIDAKGEEQKINGYVSLFR